MAADVTTAPPTSVLAAVLRGRRRALVLWSLALAAISGIYTSFYPAMGGGDELAAMVENLPDGLVSALGYDRLGTAAGYLMSTVYGLLGPALLLVFAIGTGARLVAGEEEEGTLELELAHPVSRRQVVGERLLALVAALALLTTVLAVTTTVLVATLDLDVATSNLAAATTGLLLMVVGFGTIALAAGAATGRRSVALGVAAGLAVAAFVADAVGPLVDGAGWLTAVSPWSWYLAGEPLVEGWDVPGMLRLAAIPVIAAVVGVLAFDRRDLGT